MMITIRSLAIPAAVALALAACNSDLTAPTIEGTVFAPALNVDLAASTHTASGMYYRELQAGGGALLVAGHTIAVRYTGALPSGVVFDSNTGAATPFSFTFGAGEVIAGFDEGLAGMHVGGSRQLIIPPSLGYGASPKNGIPGNSILVFTVTVVSSS
jgi:FKBP-type peptidyl-prolyl cis-trans isomerase